MSAQTVVQENASRPIKKSQQQLRVLTLTPFYPLTGDETSGAFVEEPLHWFEAAGVVHTVLAAQPFYRGNAGIRPGSYPASRFRYPTLPKNAGLAWAGIGLYLRIRSRARKLHATNPLDLIHAHGPLPCGHAAALLARELRIPFVVTVHGRDVFSSCHGGLSARLCEQRARFVYHSATRVICVSAKVAEELATTIGDRLTVVHNGVDVERFRPDIAAEHRDPVVLSIGNLIRTKGHAVLLEAFARIKRDFPGLRCQIIGSGPELRRLLELADKFGMSQQVDFLGRQTRQGVADLLRRCTFFALPSSYEGLGCVYLEAMATAKATIGCRKQGIEEVIEHGKNGWLVEPNDSTELAHAFSKLLRDPGLRYRLGAAARKTVVEGLTLAHHAVRLRQIYQESLS